MKNSRRNALLRRRLTARPFRGSYLRPMGEALEGRRLLAADFEPNNTFGTAVNLGTGSQSHSDGRIQTGGDEDWYRWQASTNGTVRVDLLFSHSQADLVLRLFNSSQVQVAQADTITNNERASATVAPNQQIYIQVTEFTGDHAGNYSLVITEIAPDQFESGGSGNNTPATATSLSTQDQVHNNLTLHKFDDNDYFKWTAPFDGFLTVGLAFSHADGDADVELSDNSGVLSGSQSSSDNEETTIGVTAGQQIFIHVFEARGLEHPRYDLSVDFVSPPTIDGPTTFVFGSFNVPFNVDLTVGDLDTPLNSLLLSASSSNQGIVANSGLTFSGSGTNRTLTITPKGQFGQTTITVTVNDNDGGIDELSFLYAAFESEPNDPPTISSIADKTIDENTSTGPISFTIGDTETTPSALTLSALSSDEDLVPVSNISFGGSGSSRTVTVTPGTNRAGSAEVTVRVIDENGASASESFLVTVIPVNDPNSNDPPVFDPIPNQNIGEDSGPSTINITGVGPGGGPDEAGQIVTLTATTSNPFIVPTPKINGHTLVITPEPNRFGTVTITVIATDNGGTSNGGVDTFRRSFNVTITPTNDPPTISNIKDIQASAGQPSAPQSFTITDLETPPSVLILSGTSSNQAVVADGGITFSGTGTNRFVSVTPKGAGFATITVTVTDESLASRQTTFEVFSSALNAPPTFTAGPDQNVLEDSGARTVSGWAKNISPGAGETGQSLSFKIIGNSTPGLFKIAPTISPNGTLTFTPATNAVGESTIKVVLMDDGGGTDTSAAQSFRITVTPVNDPPSFTKGPDQNVSDTTPQNVLAWATNINPGPEDEANQTLTFVVIGNTNPSLFATPPAISSKGHLTYTPAAGNGGTATITVRLMDSGGTANGGQNTSSTQSFNIKLAQVNAKPLFTKGADQTVLEDAGPQTVVGWATGISAGAANESGQALTFNVTNNTKPELFSVLPAVSPDGRLTYTPAPNANGFAKITLELVDDGGTANGGLNTSDPQIFEIALTPVNDAPSFTKGADQILLEGSGPQTVPAWATAISAGPADEAGQTLTFNVTNNTNPQLFSVAPAVAANGQLTYTPAANANGTAIITLALMDNGGAANGGVATSAAQTFQIAINQVNVAPSFVKGADQTVLEDAVPQTVAGWATGISAGRPSESAQTLTFNVTGNTNPTLFSAAPAISASGQLTYTPAANAHGSATITVRLTDNGGTANGGADTSAPQTFLINVTPVNDAPTFTKGADQTVLEDAGAQTVAGWATAMNAGAANESGQTLTFNVTNNTNPSLFSVAPAVSADGRLTYTPAANANGSATIAVRLTDSGGTANGGVDSSAAQNFQINVTPVNDAPAFTKGADQVLVQAAGPQTVPGWATAISAGPANESGQTLTFNVVNNSNPALFTAGPAVSAGGQLTYTPAVNANGAATITLVLMDNGGAANGGVDTSAAQTFRIVLTPVNVAPSFAKGTDQIVLEDAGLQTVDGWATAISAGPPSESGQTLTFNITGNTNPSLFAVPPTISPDGRLRYAPAPNARGSAEMTVRLMDNGGTANGGVDTSGPQTFEISVTPVNDAPSFTRGPDQIVDEDSGPQIVPGWATGISPGPADELGQTLTFQVTSNTNPALFSAGPTVSSNGQLTYTPAPNATGTASVTVALKDNGGTANGGVDTAPPQTIQFAVRPVNDAPEISSISDVLIPLGASSPAIPFSISDVETSASALELTATSSDQSVIPNANISLAGSGTNRTVTIASLPNQAGGPVTITVVVSDGAASKSETFLVTVIDATAPVVVAAQRNGGNGRFDQLTSLSFTFSEDVGDTLNPRDLSLINLHTGAEINLIGAALSWNPATMTARWDLSQIPLEKANYSAILSADGVRDVDGNRLDGDADGTAGGDFVANHPLTFGGDADLNFSVDFTDFLALAANFGLADRGWPGGDFDGSGRVDFPDFLALAGNFGNQLDPVVAAGEPPEILGDANLDGSVDFADFLILSDNYGQSGKTWPEGDFTGDGQVQFDDFVVLAEALRIDNPAPTSVVSEAFAEDDENETDWWQTDEMDDLLSLGTRIDGSLK